MFSKSNKMNMFDQTLEKLLSGESLSYQEAYSAMISIMNGDIPPSRLAAWLTLLKVKGENADEISGCAAAMREKSIKIRCNNPNAVDTCGTGGDNLGTFNVSTAAAIIASGAGLTVAKHGNRAVSGKCGSADVLEKLGIDIRMPKEKAEKCLNQLGIVFLFAPDFHPAMKFASPVRRELGFRTIFNILGPLSNPALVKKGVIGVYSKKLCKIIAEAAAKIGYEDLIVVHSEDGLDEISLSAPTLICEIRNGEFLEYEFNPIHHGFNFVSIDIFSGTSPEENAELILQILNPKLPDSPQRQISIINAAAAIFASNKTKNWDEAINAASLSISSGAALKKLEDWKKFSESN